MNEISNKINNFNYRKQEFFNKSIYKIITDKKIEPSLKELLNKTKFVETYNVLFDDILDRIDNNDIPSFEYLKEKYNYKEIYSDMTQLDIKKVLADIYIQEMFTTKFIEFTPQIKNSDIKSIKNFVDVLSNVVLEMEEVNLTNFANYDLHLEVLQSFKNESNLVTFNNFEPFNKLRFQISNVMGILAPSGRGKSKVLQKLHVSLDPNEYVVLHYSLELPKALFLSRLYGALEWINYKQIKSLSLTEIEYYSRRLEKEFPNWFFYCRDTNKQNVTLSKIEKSVKYYKSKFPDKKIILFIDYLQLLDEDFDANTCRVADKLSAMTVRNGIGTIVALQSNTEGEKYGKPPEKNMIGFVNTLHNGMDYIQSFYGVNSEDNESKLILPSQTKKSREGNISNFTYIIDESAETNKWQLVG